MAVCWHKVESIAKKVNFASTGCCCGPKGLAYKTCRVYVAKELLLRTGII